MKQLSITIEHRNFNLNIQDEYYDKLIESFNKHNNISLNGNNAISDILSMCIANVIELIDIEYETQESITKIDATSYLK
jgi:hypothetical protein